MALYMMNADRLMDGVDIVLFAPSSPPPHLHDHPIPARSPLPLHQPIFPHDPLPLSTTTSIQDDRDDEYEDDDEDDDDKAMMEKVATMTIVSHVSDITTS